MDHLRSNTAGVFRALSRLLADFRCGEEGLTAVRVVLLVLAAAIIAFILVWLFRDHLISIWTEASNHSVFQISSAT